MCSLRAEKFKPHDTMALLSEGADTAESCVSLPSIAALPACDGASTEDARAGYSSSLA